MKKAMVCGMVLGCASLMGIAQAQGTATDQDKQFLQTASKSDYTEMTFSKLALQKSQNATVRQFAQKMITDHQTLEAEMQPYAQQWGVSPVTTLDSMHQQKYDQLSQLSGADFDKQYMSDMTTDHRTSLDAFKAEESSTTVPKFKTTVKKGEKVVAEHLQMAQKDDTKLGAPATGA